MKELEIIKHFGVKSQLKKLNEEVYEFIEAVNDFAQEEGSKEHVEEELADIIVVLSGYIKLYDLNKNNIKKMINFKLDRTIERIASRYYEKR